MLDIIIKIGVISVIKRLTNQTHLALMILFEKYVENHLPLQRRNEIRFYEVFVPLRKRLGEANNKAPLINQKNKRDAHILNADNYFRRFRKSVTGRSAEETESIVSEAKTLNSVIRGFGEIPNKAVNTKIQLYLELMAELKKHSAYIADLSLTNLVDKFFEEIVKAAKAQVAIDNINEYNSENAIATIRIQIDAAYRNAMNLLNSRRAVERELFDCEEFMLRWAEKLSEFLAAFATAQGARITRREKKSEIDGNGNGSTTKKRYRTPKPQRTRIANPNAVMKIIKQNDYDCIIIPPPSDDGNIPLWSAGEHYTQMKIGDKRRTADGRIWELIDLGQAHRDPAGEFGYFGWRLVG